MQENTGEQTNKSVKPSAKQGKSGKETVPVMSFEAGSARLSEIVQLLEKGDATLDEAIRLFEEGASLAGHCQGLLDRAEQKVVRLIKNRQGELDEAPFDGEEREGQS